MAIEIIDLGTVAQDGADGDVAREAFEKVNANFAEHEAEINALTPRVTTLENQVGQLEIQAGQIQGDLTNLTESFNVLSSEVGTNTADIQNLENSREYTLVPGEGITIDRTNPSSPVISSTGSSGSVWGQITGNLSDQIDLQNALNGKVDKIEGKQLSTEDFTTVDKNNLSLAVINTERIIGNSDDNEGAGAVPFDSTKDYPEGTVGAVLNRIKSYRQIKNVGELKSSPGLFDGEIIYLEEYGPESAYPTGSGLLKWSAGSTETPDNGMVFSLSSSEVGRWLRQDIVVDAGFYGLPLSSGFCYTQVSAIEHFAFENERNIYFGPGVYDVGDANWPFRNTEVPPSSFKDYKGLVINTAGASTVFKTTSSLGADVLQLNAVKGLSILGYPTVTATLLSTAGAGSNGVSFTFGGENIVIEVDCENLPFVDKGNYGDGGKAYTLQTGEGNSLGYNNLRISGKAKNVLYGFGIDADYDNLALYPINGVQINLFIEEAYRAYVIGLAGPTEIPERLPICGVFGEILAKNCQQYVVDSRGVGCSVNFQIMSDKEKSQLIKLSSDPLVLVSDIKATKHSQYNITGSVKSIDTCLSIGGIFMGGGVSGKVDHCKIYHDVSYTSATTACEVTNFGGNSVDLCEISLYNFESGYLPIISDGSNSLKVNGVDIFPTVFPGDVTIAAVRSPNFSAIYTQPLSTIRSVILPTQAVIGDKIKVSRTNSSTGSTLAVGSIRNISAGQWVELIYSGISWQEISFGSV